MANSTRFLIELPDDGADSDQWGTILNNAFSQLEQKVTDKTAGDTVNGALVVTGALSGNTVSGAGTGLTGTAANLTAGSANSAAGGQFSHRNRIINGNFDIAQRGTTGTVGSGAFGYVSLDRWYANNVPGISCGLTRTAVVGGLEQTYGRFYLAAAFSGTGVSGSNVGQRIENVRQFGGVTVTLSFFAADSVATSMSVVVRQSFGTGGTPSAAVDTTINNVTVPSQFAATKTSLTFSLPSISGKTLGTNGDDYLDVIFVPNAANAHTFSLAQVQLEIGSVATPFEHRPVGTELALCQRYARPVDIAYPFVANGTTGGFFAIQLNPPMRSLPSLSPGSGTTVIFYNSSVTSTATPTVGAVTNSGVTLNISGFTGLNTSLPYIVTAAAATPHILTAEL